MKQGAKRVAIIGAGPAGLSMAKLIADRSTHAVTLYEKEPRVGGKSLSILQGEDLIEFGTCYAVQSHKVVMGWMRNQDITLQQIPPHNIDGAPAKAFFNSGSGGPLALQGVQYLLARKRLVERLQSDAPSRATLEEAAMPAVDWLRRRGLGKIEKLLQRVVTGLGYGDLADVPMVHVIRWVDFDLIVSGVFNRVFMPVEGWSEFWQRLAEPMDVRLEADIRSIYRGKDGHSVSLSDGSEKTFDAIICAIPVDQFNRLVSPTESERVVADAVEWNGFATTLISSQDWFTEDHIQFYSDSTLPGAPPGQLLSARREGHDEGLGGHLYIANQLVGDYSGPELREILEEEIHKRDATINAVIQQQIWQYFPHYKPQAIREGLLARMRHMQGEQNTWYTGASFSHEAVSNITKHNETIIGDLLKALN